jgi:hypothetical protein
MQEAVEHPGMAYKPKAAKEVGIVCEGIYGPVQSFQAASPVLS